MLFGTWPANVFTVRVVSSLRCHLLDFIICGRPDASDCGFLHRSIFPGSQTTAKEHQLPEVISVVIGYQQRFTQEGLAIAVGNPSE